jgi:hypothetical protein
MPLPKSRKAAVGTSTSAVPTPCTEFVERWPELYLWLTQEAYEDGSDRKTSSLSLFFDGGLLKVMLNDRDTGRVAFTTAEGLLDACDSLERQLAEGTVVFRRSAFAGAKK